MGFFTHATAGHTLRVGRLVTSTNARGDRVTVTYPTTREARNAYRKLATMLR